MKYLPWHLNISARVAKSLRLPAVLFATFSAVIWSITALVGAITPSAYGHWSFLYAILYILLAWGLFKMRREAAIAYFAILLIGLFFNLESIGEILLISVFLISSIFAIIGTFAYYQNTKVNKNL